MKLSIVAICLTLITSSMGFADVIREEKPLLKCNNEQSNFIVRNTAVPTLFQGVLSDSTQHLSFFYCHKVKYQPPPIADGFTTLYDCESQENPNHGVSVETGGFAGLTQARVYVKRDPTNAEYETTEILYCK